MGFLNPWLLLGIAGIASPIIIHLLAKKQIKRVVWAAMRFLKITVDRNQRKMTLEDLLLLLLRCLILILLALALARPAIRQGGIGIAGGDEAIIILLDNSGSMSTTDGAASRFEKAQKATGQILDALPGGSKVAVWLVSDTVRESIPEPTRDLALARKSVREAKRGDLGTEWQPALRRAIDVLRRQPGVQKHIYAVTDGQTAGWKGIAEMRNLLEGVKKEMQASLILIGDGELANVGVTDVRLASALASVNQPLRFEVSIANYGPEEIRNVAVSLGIDEDRPSDEQTLDVLPPGGVPKTLSLFATFREPGFHTVTAHVHPDRCPFDDQRSFALRVIDEVNVLLVDGDPGVEPRDSEVFYLRNALVPVPVEFRDRFFIKTKTVTGAEFDKVALKDFEAVVLANVVDLSPVAADALQNYVRLGGGLMVFPGSRISVPFYNERLLGERGLLPASFGEPRGDPVDESKAERPPNFFHLQSKEYAHRIVELWKDPASGSLAGAQFYHALSLVPAKKSDVPGEAGPPAVVLVFGDGQPAVMERSYGFGRVLQFGSTADGAWNDLPVRPVFLPLMHRALGFLLARFEDRLNVRAGTPFSYAVAMERAGKDYVVSEPAAKRDSARPKSVMVKGNVPLVEQADTSMAGVYSVGFIEDGSNAVRFAAAADPAEGDLHEISAADIATLAPVAQVVKWTPTIDLRGLLQRERTGTELWLPLALLAALLVVVDTVVGNRFQPIEMSPLALTLLAVGYVLLMFANPVRASLLDGWRCVRRYPVIWRMLALLGFAHALFHLAVRMVLHFQFVPELVWVREGPVDSPWWLPPSAIRQELRDGVLPAFESVAGIFNNAITTFPLAVIGAIGLFVNRHRYATLLRKTLRRRFGAWAWPLLAGVYLGAAAVVAKAALYFVLPLMLNPAWFQWAPLIAWVAAIFEYLFGVGIQIYLILHAYAWVRGLSFEPDALREVAVRRLGAGVKWAGIVIAASSLLIELPLVLKNFPAFSAVFPNVKETVELRVSIARIGLSVVLLCFASMQAWLALHGETLRRAWRAHWRFIWLHGWEFFWFIVIAGVHLFAVQAVRGLVLRGLGDNTAPGLLWTLVWPLMGGLVMGWCLAAWVCLFKRCEG